MPQLTALTGLHPRAVRRHLVGLPAAGLVTAGASGRTWARSLAAGDPEQLGGALTEAAGTAGVYKRRDV